MPATSQRPSFADPKLRAQMAPLRAVDNITNLLYLVVEYLSLFVVIGGAIGFVEFRGAWGISWFWNVPVVTAAILLVGGLQHRLAGLGHEASHYTFMKNKFLND